MSGYGLKAFQLVRIDQRAFRKHILSIVAQGVMLTTVSGWLPVMASLLLLLYLSDTPVSVQHLTADYERRFGVTISEEELAARLAELGRMKLAERNGRDAYLSKENVILRR